MEKQKIINVRLEELTANLFVGKEEYTKLFFKSCSGEDRVDSFVTEPWQTVLGEARLVISKRDSSADKLLKIPLRKANLAREGWGAYEENPPYIVIHLGIDQGYDESLKSRIYRPSIRLVENIKQLTPEMNYFSLLGYELKSYPDLMSRPHGNLADKYPKEGAWCTRLLGEVINRMSIRLEPSKHDSDERYTLEVIQDWHNRKNHLVELYTRYTLQRIFPKKAIEIS